MFHFMKNNPTCELKRYFWVTNQFVQRSAAADVDAAELGFAQFRKSRPLQVQRYQEKDSPSWILPKKTSIWLKFLCMFFFCRMFFFVCFIFFPSLSDLQIKYESFWVCKTQVIALMNKPSAWHFTQMFNSPNQVTSLQIRVVTDDRESTKRWDLPIVGFSIWISSFVGFDQMKLRTTMTILVLDWTSLSITMNIMNTANLVNDPLGHVDLLCSTTSSKTFCSVSELPWTFIIPPCRWHWTKTNLLF